MSYMLGMVIVPGTFLCTTTHISPLLVIEFCTMMPVMIETPQLFAFKHALQSVGGNLVFLTGLSCWQTQHPSYYPLSRWTENCLWLLLQLRGKDIHSLIFNKVGFSLVYYERYWYPPL